MTTRIGAKGQVVIPKSFRDQLDLHPGGAVEFEVSDGRLVVRSAEPRTGLGGRFKASGMAGRLLADRAREPR